MPEGTPGGEAPTLEEDLARWLNINSSDAGGRRKRRRRRRKTKEDREEGFWRAGEEEVCFERRRKRGGEEFEEEFEEEGELEDEEDEEGEARSWKSWKRWSSARQVREVEERSLRPEPASVLPPAGSPKGPPEPGLEPGLLLKWRSRGTESAWAWWPPCWPEVLPSQGGGEGRGPPCRATATQRACGGRPLLGHQLCWKKRGLRVGVISYHPPEASAVEEMEVEAAALPRRKVRGRRGRRRGGGDMRVLTWSVSATVLNFLFVLEGAG